MSARPHVLRREPAHVRGRNAQGRAGITKRVARFSLPAGRSHGRRTKRGEHDDTFGDDRAGAADIRQRLCVGPAQRQRAISAWHHLAAWDRTGAPDTWHRNSAGQHRGGVDWSEPDDVGNIAARTGPDGQHCDMFRREFGGRKYLRHESRSVDAHHAGLCESFRRRRHDGNGLGHVRERHDRSFQSCGLRLVADRNGRSFRRGSRRHPHGLDGAGRRRRESAAANSIPQSIGAVFNAAHQSIHAVCNIRHALLDNCNRHDHWLLTRTLPGRCTCDARS